MPLVTKRFPTNFPYETEDFPMNGKYAKNFLVSLISLINNLGLIFTCVKILNISICREEISKLAVQNNKKTITHLNQQLT